ncbi:hypothetical protein DMH27_17530 [Raoultella planticola]|nr:hypothetical protein [Raoultella planticola]
MVFIFMCAMLFIFPDLPKGIIEWHHSGPILSGVIIVPAVGDIIIRHAEKSHEKLTQAVN